jgi:uncharacterized protein (DUF2141 family)
MKVEAVICKLLNKENSNDPKRPLHQALSQYRGALGRIINRDDRILAVTLTVHVTGARNAKGQIRAALFQSAKGFPGDASQAIQTQAADIDPQSLSAQIVFTGLHEGVYAVSVFHDENMNRKLDKNFLGIPKEGYGASNNPKKKMGPPDFEETKFQLSGAGQPLEIRLVY